LQHLYEAARLVINSRQCRLELAFQYLIMAGVLPSPAAEATLAVHPQLEQLNECWSSYCTEFCGVAHLKTVLLRQALRFGDSLRCIIFVQQRVTTHILKHFIDSEPELRFIRSDVIYATSSPATAELSVTASQARERLSNFATGQINVLIATSVAEEGMDIPAANCVVRFDHVQTPVSLVQSRGRARQLDSAFVVMREDSSRTVCDLQAAEQQQHAVIAAINTTGIVVDENMHQKKLVAQASRKRGAVSVFERHFAQPPDKRSCMATINSYSQKVAGEVTTRDKKVTNSVWSTTVSFVQFGEAPLCGRGEGATKKDSAKAAASHLLDQLQHIR
jgi:superfamily II DNA/RNA helicase